MSVLPSDSDTKLAALDEPLLQDFLSFSIGKRLFAVPAGQVEGTAETRRPAVLPNSPPAILGVVCVRGRMLTTLDPVALTAGERFDWPVEVPWVVALRGDEQLALACESLGETITVAATDIQTNGESEPESGSSIISGVARHGGQEIAILKVERLFSAAFQRTERRRRRF